MVTGLKRAAPPAGQRQTDSHLAEREGRHDCGMIGESEIKEVTMRHDGAAELMSLSPGLLRCKAR